MRNLKLLDQYRRTDKDVIRFYGSVGDQTCGVFAVPSKIDRAPLMVIASSDLGWDHVSVSRKNRIPNWAEMSQIKGLFFKDDETAMQLHVPVSDHVNDHPYCLHLWRPHDNSIPRPPSCLVGGMTKAEADIEVARLMVAARANAPIIGRRK
jgi:hypothetical protein